MTHERATIGNQTEGSNAQPKASRVKWLTAGGCGTVLLLVLAGIGVGFFVLYGGGGDPANAGTAETVARRFVEALKAGDVESAHRMFVEEVRSELSPADLASDLKTNETTVAIKQYESLQVCEWGFAIKNDGHYLTSQGLIHYKDGDMVFISELRKDSDAAWRIVLFQLRPDIEPKPWGGCR